MSETPSDYSEGLRSFDTGSVGLDNDCTAPPRNRRASTAATRKSELSVDYFFLGLAAGFLALAATVDFLALDAAADLVVLAAFFLGAALTFILELLIFAIMASL